MDTFSLLVSKLTPELFYIKKEVLPTWPPEQQVEKDQRADGGDPNFEWVGQSDT